MSKKAALALALLLPACTLADQAVDRVPVNIPSADDKLVRVRTERLPYSRILFILRDQVSGRCFTYDGDDVRQVTDDVCGQP